MNFSKKLALPTVFITAAMFSGVTYASSHPSSDDSAESRSQVEFSEIQALLSANVTLSNAIQLAIAKYDSSSVIEVEIEHEHSRLYYKVTLILADGTRLKVFVNSSDGAVVPFEEFKSSEYSDSYDDSDDDYDDSDDDDHRSGSDDDSDDDDSDDDDSRSGSSSDDSDDDDSRSGSSSDDSDDDDKSGSDHDSDDDSDKVGS